MTGIKGVTFVVVLTFLQSLARGDAVNCVFNESCILPCRFQAGDKVIIHWYQETAVDTVAHSYYYNQDQYKHQNQHFRGRTSLFRDHISKGNASLQLTRVTIQDEGRYECYTSTPASIEPERSYINLTVDAPVRKVDIQQEPDMMTCSSEGIYPQPELTWSTNPPSNVILRNNTTVQQTEHELYNVRSSLTVSVSDLEYSCTISTRSSRRTTTLFKPTSISGSQTETTIPCMSSTRALTDLIWRFNHSQIILTQTGANVPYEVSKEWTQQVKNMSESGSLTIRNLSSNQEGIYSCELSDAEETYITSTTLKIIEDSHVPVIVGGLTGAIVFVAAVGLAAFFIDREIRRRRQIERARQQPNNQDIVQPELVPLQDRAQDGGGRRPSPPLR